MWTTSGNPIVLYDIETGKAERINGAYFVGDMWIPLNWDLGGKHRLNKQKSNLDIDWKRATKDETLPDA